MDNLLELFEQFVAKTKRKLDAIDQKGYETSNCLDKLPIYEEFATKLIEKCRCYIATIQKLSSEFTKHDSTATSTMNSTLSSTLQNSTNEKVLQEIEFFSYSINKRLEDDEQALNSLKSLETIIKTMLTENRRLSKENDQSESTSHMSESIVASVTENLRQENNELKQIINRNEQTIQMIENSSKIVIEGGREIMDQSNRIEVLERELKEKSNAICKLSSDLNRLNHMLKEKTEEIKDISKHKERIDNLLVSNCYTSDLSDTETDEQRKIKLFEEGSKEMASILKEKYQQLRDQRAKINELVKALENCNKEKESRDLRNKIMDLERKNAQLAKELEHTVPLKENYEKWEHEMKELVEREQILRKKLTLQDEHIKTLLEERKRFNQISNAMLNSILVCQNELSKYNVKQDERC